MKKTSVLLLLIMTTFHFVNAQDAAKKADIMKLLEMAGIYDMGDEYAKAISEQVTHALKKSKPKTTDKTIGILNKELKIVINNAMREPQGIGDIISKTYAKYFTHDEVKKLIAFYETPVGKKLLEVTPIVQKEYLTEGQKWFSSIGPTVIKRLRGRLQKKGITLPEM
jgi:hypothetical protein